MASSGDFPFSGPSSPIQIKQGDVYDLKLQIHKEAVSVHGKFRKRTIPFFPTETPGEFRALIGSDLNDPAAVHDFRVTVTRPSGKVDGSLLKIEVLPAKFKKQKLTVDQKYLDLDEETVQRVMKEKKEVLGSFKVTPQRLWSEGFVRPVEGESNGSFGKKRIINGARRSPHSGEDFRATQGTPVRATAAGLVSLTGEHFFAGKSIYLDHGLGFYSMYFHLDKIHVSKGDRIEKGGVIGEVGSSGRATGPHLHWGTRLNGARVNPLSILGIK